ncbi:MAG: hypothetical protein JWQ42_3437 [Edaphobacter sp.]|nr:hypothetical protein [Edaphobacter sp.]
MTREVFFEEFEIESVLLLGELSSLSVSSAAQSFTGIQMP